MSSQSTTTSKTTQKHEAILAQAIRTFAEEGFRNADVQVIADRASVGKGTVYRYFGNKEDLFWATILEILDRLEARLLASFVGIDGAIPRLKAIGGAYCGFFDDNPDYLELFVQDRAEFRGSAPDRLKEKHENLVARFAVVFERGVAAGQLRPLDIRKSLESYGSLLYGCVVFACYTGADLTARDITEHAIEIFLEGLQAKPSSDEAPLDKQGSEE